MQQLKQKKNQQQKQQSVIVFGGLMQGKGSFLQLLQQIQFNFDIF